jgi:hypothetical protein
MKCYNYNIFFWLAVAALLRAAQGAMRLNCDGRHYSCNNGATVIFLM